MALSSSVVSLDQTLEPPRPWPQHVPRGGRIYSVGSDIAQIRDASATVIVQHLVTLEREADHLLGTPALYVTTFQVLGCERRPAGEAYPVQAKRLCQLCRRLVDRDSDAAIHLIMDQTGVGKPVLDLVRESINHRVMTTGVTITGGSAEKGASQRPYFILWLAPPTRSPCFRIRLYSNCRAMPSLTCTRPDYATALITTMGTMALTFPRYTGSMRVLFPRYAYSQSEAHLPNTQRPRSTGLYRKKVT